MMERDPALVDIVRDWLFEQKIFSENGYQTPDGSIAVIKGFGWAIVIENSNVTFANRFENEVIQAPIADPAILDKIKTKILYVESNIIDYIVEHVDDDGWGEIWKNKISPPLGGYGIPNRKDDGIL